MTKPISPSVAFSATRASADKSSRVDDIIDYVNKCIADAMERGFNGPITVGSTRSGWTFEDISAAERVLSEAGWVVAVPRSIGVLFVLSYPTQMMEAADKADYDAAVAPRDDEPSMVDYELVRRALQRWPAGRRSGCR